MISVCSYTLEKYGASTTQKMVSLVPGGIIRCQSTCCYTEHLHILALGENRILLSTTRMLLVTGSISPTDCCRLDHRRRKMFYKAWPANRTDHFCSSDCCMTGHCSCKFCCHTELVDKLYADLQQVFSKGFADANVNAMFLTKSCCRAAVESAKALSAMVDGNLPNQDRAVQAGAPQLLCHMASSLPQCSPSETGCHAELSCRCCLD